ncbi:hypothetical protein ACU4GD_18670 [Cupriavidus basilensis]
MPADVSLSKSRIVIADDHPVMLVGPRGLLAQFESVEIAGIARNSTEILALLSRQPCEILLTDYAMPGGTHGDGLHMIEVPAPPLPGAGDPGIHHAAQPRAAQRAGQLRPLVRGQQARRRIPYPEGAGTPARWRALPVAGDTAAAGQHRPAR